MCGTGGKDPINDHQYSHRVYSKKSVAGLATHLELLQKEENKEFLNEHHLQSHLNEMLQMGFHTMRMVVAYDNLTHSQLSHLYQFVIDPHFYSTKDGIPDPELATRWLWRILMHFTETFLGLNTIDEIYYLHETFGRCDHQDDDRDLEWNRLCVFLHARNSLVYHRVCSALYPGGSKKQTTFKRCGRIYMRNEDDIRGSTQSAGPLVQSLLITLRDLMRLSGFKLNHHPQIALYDSSFVGQ